jgi:hypothetical protein
MQLTNLDVSVSPAVSGPGSIADIDEISPRTGPPSETSSQDWDKISNPDRASEPGGAT